MRLPGFSEVRSVLLDLHYSFGDVFIGCCDLVVWFFPGQVRGVDVERFRFQE